MDELDPTNGDVFDLAPSFLAVLHGPDHVFTRANRAYMELVGTRELIGLPVPEALTEVTEQGFVTLLDRAYRSGEPFTAAEVPIRLRRSGEEPEERFVTFVYQPLRGGDGEVEGIVTHGVDVTDHVRTRKALEARESHFRSLIEHSEDLITVLSETGRVIYRSPAGERLLGWAKDEVLGREMLDLVHPDDQDLVRRGVGEALAEPGRSARVKVRLLHKDGSWRIFESTGHARQGEYGLEVVINSRDITERLSRDAEFETLVELMPQLVWSTTPDGYPDFFNERWYEYTGMERSGDQGWNWKDYLHPDDYERTLEIWHHSLATGEPYEIEYRFRRASDGAYRWLIARAHPLRSPEGQILRWFGTCTDVHDERMALEAAEESQERFRAVTRATNDVVWDWDLTTDTIWRNDNVESVLGFAPKDLGSDAGAWGQRIHPEDRDRVLDGLNAAVERGEDRWADEYRFIRSDGTIAYLLDRGRMVRGRDGEPVSMVGAVTDLTARHRLETELRQAQKMEALGKLTGGIAHDFNNLLTVITNSSEMMLEDLPEDHDLREDLQEIRKAASRAVSVTRQLLAYSRKQVLQPRDLDLNEVVGGTLKLLRSTIGEGIRLDFLPADDLPTVHADPGQVEQVIINLALNARDAMPKGGTLTMVTEIVRVDDEQARKAGTEPGDFVVLSARDTGIGMDAVTRARAFDPFFTTKPGGEGTGLGLSTVFGIVRQSGGFIELESEVGEGSVFRIHLPVRHADQRPTGTHRSRREGSGADTAPREGGRGA
ncbi:MAG: PAS domain S-box protein [Gemmatimonadota bacterium]